MTDDQNESMEGLASTQSLLAGQGTTFRNSYVSFPLCCPSRATFLTGQYSHNHGVFTTELPNGYNGLNHANTLPVWLRSSGYRTAMVGKYLNGYGIDDGIVEPTIDALEIPPGWSEWYGLTGGLEQRRYKYKLNEQGKIRFYKAGARNYVTDVLSSKAVDFVDRQAPFPKPFFMWFNPTAPHGEAGVFPGALRDPAPAPRHLGRYEFASAPRTPSFDEADVTDKPPSVRTTPKLTVEQIADIDRRYRSRLESLLSVDDAVRQIVGRLKKTGDLKRTYIFFTSDNGLLLGAHRLLFKNYIYEESTRVPLIVRGPAVPQGRRPRPTRQQRGPRPHDHRAHGRDPGPDDGRPLPRPGRPEPGRRHRARDPLRERGQRRLRRRAQRLVRLHRQRIREPRALRPLNGPVPDLEPRGVARVRGEAGRAAGEGQRVPDVRGRLLPLGPDR